MGQVFANYAETPTWRRWKRLIRWEPAGGPRPEESVLLVPKKSNRLSESEVMRLYRMFIERLYGAGIVAPNDENRAVRIASALARKVSDASE